MKTLRHIWLAIRYGEWSAGWDSDWGKKPDEPFFHFSRLYYDGHHCYVRIGKGWFGVTYI